MRPPRFILVLVLPLVAACDSPFGPDDTRGTRLTSGQRMDYEGTLAWVPGSELVAFISSGLTGGCAIKTVDAASGSTTVIDDDCGTHFLTEPPLRNLVVASDGSALYYSVGGAWVNGGASRNLRVAEPASGEVTTLRSDVPAWLALSPDGQQLAYQSLGDSSGQHDSLIVRDLLSGVETNYGTGIGSPILFSPDGTELLYAVPAYPLTVRRLSLSDGRSEPVSLPDAGARWLFHWDDSGLRVFSKSGIDYHVHNLTIGDSIHVGATDWWGIVYGGRTWSTDGTRVSYWIWDCLESGGFFGPCLDGRYSLFVADTRSGNRVRVAYTKAASAGPTVFSPDGRRIVYSLGGDLYISEVP